MTDGQALYLTLAALYVIECATWVSRGAAAFIAKSPEKARISFPRRGLSNNRGGIVIGKLLPGAVATFVVPQWPISMGSEGVLGWVSESLELSERAFQTGSFRRFDDADKVYANGRDVVVGGETFVTAASSRVAARVANEIKRLRDLPKKKRQPTIEQALDGLFDVAAARARRDAFWKATRALGFASFAVFVAAFVGAPAAIIALGIEDTWPFILGVVYSATWVTAALFYRAHRALSPDARIERIGQTILIALLPISAMRASDAIARTVLHGFHPLAVAAVLLPRDEWKSLAEHLLRDAAHPRRPVCLSDEPEAQEIEAWYRGALRRRIEALSTREGLDVAALTAAPEPSAEETEARLYCPRCCSLYAADTEVCEDCGGVPVFALPEGDIERVGKNPSSANA